jgi:subtilase family serine protease
MRNCKAVFRRVLLTAGLIGASIGVCAARDAVPYPTVATPRSVDRGELKSLEGRTPITVTVALGLKDLNGAESLMRELNTPGSAQYHQFLSAAEFETRFAPDAASVARAISALARYGLSAERATATTLHVTGLPADLERAFGVTLHSYEVPAHGNVPGYRFHAPLAHAAVPAGLAGIVAGIAGLDSRPSMYPHRIAAPAASVKRVRNPAPTLRAATTTGNPFGELTVTDFANQYDVVPLYNEGVLGRHKTVGIMTFANFTPSDAFAYWAAVGLTVDPNRLTVVAVDGGAGAPSDASGSDESTLDTEQSGGVAPAAKVIVYQAPNTNQAFVDVLAQAVSDNKADSLSMSWGAWEWFYNLENTPVTDPISGRTVSATQAFHELLVRAAIQGQSVFTSAGDGGAYEVNHDLNCYGPYSSADPNSCSLTLSVDYPASDTAITAAGGTTLPGTQEFCLNAGCTPPYFTVVIPHEQAWGWDYLDGLCTALGLDPISCGIFGVGGGGGVSVSFGLPSYQFGLNGVQTSQPHQLFQAGSAFVAEGIPPSYRLPAHFAGRNVPDVSFNADPETGYDIYYTSDVNGPEIETFIGGTSFVAPQLNGVAALLGQYNHGQRVGLLNFAFYNIAQRGDDRRGSAAPINTIAYGDNWFYHARNGYSPAAGLGTLDVTQFAKALVERD